MRFRIEDATFPTPMDRRQAQDENVLNINIWYYPNTHRVPVQVISTNISTVFEAIPDEPTTAR